MTDKKKPPSFGEHSKEFLESFEKATKELQEERAELRRKKQLVEDKLKGDKKKQESEQKALLESLKKLDEIDKGTVEKPAEDPTDILREAAEAPSDDRMSRYVKTLREVDEQQQRREVSEGVQLKETDLLGAADQPVTQAQLRSATGEMFARIQTSLASLGGGGLGKIEQGVRGTPSGGQLPMYSDSAGGMVWATVFGVGEAYGDSDALEVVLDTVDSAYVQARVNVGLDSAQILSFINDSYVSNMVGFNQTQIALDSDQIVALIESRMDSSADSGHYKTVNHDSDTVAQVDSAYIAARLPDLYDTPNHDSDTLVQVDSAYVQARIGDLYDTPDHDSDTLAQVDSAYVQARQLVYGDLDVRQLLAGDSGVFNIMPAADSTYDLGDSNTRWRDLWLSGNTLHLGSQAIKSGTDGVYANDRLLAFADSVYTTPQHDSDTLVQVDSAYVQARQIRTVAGLDDTQIDSATIASDDFLRWNGTDWIAAPFNIDPGLSFNGSIDATVGGDSAPSASGGALYVNTTSGVVGASYTGIAGDSIDSGQAIAFADSDGEWHILGSIAEASVVEVRQGNGISIDDSNPARPFVSINRTETDTWYLDSARTIAMIDSAYVQQRQLKYLDSAQITNLIDSAYVQARDSDLGGDHYKTADHDSDTLVQVDSAYVNLRADHYTTANHDSDTLIQVDSAYVQARQLLGSSVTVDSVAPTSPTNGQLWYDNTSGVLHIRDSGLWDSINAQDSGAYLELAGGTVTGPLNLDSGGIQFGPEEDRRKLVAGVYTRIETWTSQDNAFDSATGASGFGVADLAYDPDTDILIAASRKDHTVFWSDDKGISWQRSTDSAGNPWTLTGVGIGNEEIRNAFYLPEVNRWFAGDTSFQSVWMSDNGKDNWRQLTYDSVNSTNSIATFAGYHFDVIYDDSLNPVIYTSYGGNQLGRSFDSGSTWILLDHDEIGFDGLPEKGGRPFYSKQRRLSKSVGSEGTMYSSTDARNWTKLAVADSSPGNTVTISMFTLFDSDLDIVIHNGGDGLTGETYWSDNFGETWNLAKIEADSGSFTLEIVDVTKTETGAYYAIANSDSYGRGGYTSVDLKEWYLVDKITGAIVPDIQAVEHLGDGNYVRAGKTFTDNISTSSFSSSSVDIGTLNFDGNRVMLKPDMDSEHAWNIAEHSNLFDSVQALIDSDHAWANETFYDSVAIKTLIDSAYISARVTPGTIMAGGRFIADGSFTHDSSDIIPSSFVKSLWGIRNIVREDAGLYKVNFDSANNVALQDSYSYIVQTTIDYNDDNPTASTRNVAVLDQDSDHFVVLMERADDGVNQDYTSADQDDRGARITFSVIKAI